MRDTLLHIPLYAAYGLVMLGCFTVLPPWFAAALAGWFVGFIRDVTQVQAKYGNDIRTGWNFRKWSRQKQQEVFAPLWALLALAAIAHVYFPMSNTP
jgi:hypothetical protein